MKFLISLVTRLIPRKYLHLVSHFFLRILAKFMEGNGFTDPINGKNYKRFLPYGRMKSRKNALSPATLSLERHRLMFLYLKNKTQFFSSQLKVLHIAPEYCFIRLFKSLPNLTYLTADLESPWADIKMDINDMPFEENYFDVVFCNHVLEHIPDDIHAMRQIQRVLKPGGWALLQVPMNPNSDQTDEDLTLKNPREREKRFLQSDHFRLYGKDYSERLKRAGFNVHIDKLIDELPTEDRTKYALMEGEWLYIAIKPENHDSKH
jgi:SAM-dependent methyltransferase